MKISVELTLTPLQNDFESPIISFITTLRNSSFKTIETPLSTQIYGDYSLLMTFLTEEIQAVFSDSEHILIHMKIVKSDRSKYEPDF